MYCSYFYFKINQLRIREGDKEYAKVHIISKQGSWDLNSGLSSLGIHPHALGILVSDLDK